MRQKKSAALIPGLWAVCAALVALVFWTGVLDRQKTWEDMPYLLMDFGEGLQRDAQAGDAYGAMNGGPGLDLPAGTYRLKWAIEGDGDNRLVIATQNGAPVTPAEIPLAAGETQGEAMFTLETAAQGVDILVMFEGGTRIDVADMRLYSPEYRDHAFTFALLALALCALVTANRRGHLTPARRGRLILIGLAVLIASGPALKDTVCIGHDTTFHLVRLCNLADGLRSGQFPVRIGGFSYNGYGAITSVFYPDVFLYGPALLMNLGASMQYAVNVFFIAISAASALAMYAAAKRMFDDEWAAVLSSILYTLSIYRISDVFTRYAFGEMTAMVFLPLFLLGLYEVVLGDRRRWMTLGVSAACIALSHMLSTLICALAAAGMCALFIVRIVRERRLGFILKAAVLALGLCAFQLAPFLMYSMQGIGAQELAKDPAFYAISPAQLLLLGAGELSVDPKDRTLSTFALEIGLPLLLGAALALYAAATAERRDEKNRLAVLLTAAGAAFAFMATTLFPWGHVRVLTRGLSDYLQFPWRFLMMTAALLALSGGHGCARLARGHGEQMAAAVLAVAALCALPTLTDETRNPNYIAFGETVSPNLQYTEYTIPGTRTEPTLDRSVLLDGSVSVTDYRKESTTITAQVDAGTDAAVSLPLFGYDGYRATVDGQKMETGLGENNRLTVYLSAGTQGELRVWFAGKASWRIAEAVSLLTLLGLLAWTAREPAKRRREGRAAR
ncbi:MAG: 6-pyruvoyl-tetrahydropterin synthase-related protein [Candidatus Ventricola sp.]